MTASDPPRGTEGSLAPHAPDAPIASTSPASGEAAISPPHSQADQFSKNLLREALSHVSTPMPETEVEVLAAPQKIDVYAVPDPARAADRQKMGLLGEISTEPGLFEPFRNTPGLPHIRRVLCKQLTWHHELERRARASSRAATRMAASAEEAAPANVPFPWLVVLCQGRPETVLETYRFRRVRPGVYESVPALKLRVVVLGELPRTRDTLLLRMLGSDRVLAAALADMEALPEDAWEKSVADPLLLHFRLAKRDNPDTTKEDEVNAEIRAWYEDYQREQQKLRAEAIDNGRNEGRAEEAARAVLTALRVRGIAVPEAARARILAEKDPERLERWHERAIVAASIVEVIGELS